jgi:hypothetical protein
MPGDYHGGWSKGTKNNGSTKMPYWFDGNNLIGQSTARASSDRATRKSFLSYLSARFRTKGGRFLVYFDGDDPDRSMPPPGVKVRYSAPLSTDDAMLQDLAGTCNPGDVIVVTNDRGLANRSRNHGAKSITWQEFESRTMPGPIDRKKAQDQPVDVDDWMRYFGIEDE